MGGSSSKSASTTTNNTNTSNLALDGVEGLVLSNATGNTVTMTDGRAFETVRDTAGGAFKLADSQSKTSINAVRDTAGGAFKLIDRQGDRAFEQFSRALQTVDDATAAAITSVSKSGTENLDALTKNTIAGLEKINQSNQSEQQELVDKFTTVAIAGVVVYGAVTLWGNK